ncbi:MAG: hypothetical protein MHMPM18_003592 [Marteilia pararefringens]
MPDPKSKDCSSQEAIATPNQISSSSSSTLKLGIFWSPLPGITLVLPVVGHTGIIDSKGDSYDFGGYYISKNAPIFGSPTRFVQLDVNKVQKTIDGLSPTQVFDWAVDKSCKDYKDKHHNLFTQNCHHHVAHALNLMQYDGRSDWTMVDVAILANLQGKHLNLRGIFLQWSGTFMISLYLLYNKFW